MKTIKIRFLTACLYVLTLFFICSCSDVPPKEEYPDLNQETVSSEVDDFPDEIIDNGTGADVGVQPSAPVPEEPAVTEDPQPDDVDTIEPSTEDIVVPEDTQPDEIEPAEPSTEEPDSIPPEDVVQIEPSTVEPENKQPEEDAPIEPPMVEPVEHPRENPPETDPDDIVIATPTYYELPEGPRMIESEIPFPMTLDQTVLNPHSYEKLILTWGNNQGYFSPHGQYWIEKLTDGKWCEIQPIEEIPLPAKPGFGPAPRIETVDLGKYYPELTDGKYRVVKFIDGKFYAVEFVMDESSQVTP